MSLVTAVPKYAKIGQGYSRQEQARALEHPGRRRDGTQSAATWVTELSDRRKVVLFCTYCRVQFNPRRQRYRAFYNPDLTSVTSGYLANGLCDGCGQRTDLLPGGGTAFISEETYRLVCMDPLAARRRARAAARAAAGATSAWARVRASLSHSLGQRGAHRGPRPT